MEKVQDAAADALDTAWERSSPQRNVNGCRNFLLKAMVELTKLSEGGDRHVGM